MNDLITINSLAIELDKTERNYDRAERELLDIQRPGPEISDYKLLKAYCREKNRAIDKKHKELRQIRKELRDLDKKLVEAIEKCGVWIKTDVGFVKKYDPAEKHCTPINFLPFDLAGRKIEHEHNPVTIMERVELDYPIDFEEHVYCDKCWQCLDGDPEYDRDAVEVVIDENNLPF